MDKESKTRRHFLQGEWIDFIVQIRYILQITYDMDDKYILQVRVKKVLSYSYFETFCKDDI